MANTLILYDGKMSSTERASRVLGCIIGNARLTEITEAPSDISSYDGFCFIFNFYGALTAGKTKAYLFAHKDILASKRLAFVGIGFSDQGFSKYVVGMESAVGSGEITAMFISDDKQTVEAGYQIAKVMRAPVKAMGQQELLAAIGKYVTNHNTLALATAADGYVRCTPLEYIYANEAFYIITEGGFKFRGILQNDKVSAAIFDPYTDMSDITGLQIYGTSELIGRDTEEYRQILAMKNVTPEMLDKLPSVLFLVKIKPLKYDFLNSEFKKQGFDSRQSVNTDFRKKTWESGAAFVQEVAEKAKEAEEERKAKLKEAEEQAEREKNALSEAPKEIYSEEETEETPEDENETGEEDIPEEFSEFDFSKVPSAKPEEEAGAENKKLLKKDGLSEKAVSEETAEITEEEDGLKGRNDFTEEDDSGERDKDGETDDFSELDENEKVDDHKDAVNKAGAYAKEERYTEEEPDDEESQDGAAGSENRGREAADSADRRYGTADDVDRRHEDDEDSGTAGSKEKDGSEKKDTGEEDNGGKGGASDNGGDDSVEDAVDSGDEDDDDEDGEDDFDEEDFRKHFLKSKAVKSAAEKKEEKPRKHRFFMSDDDEDDEADEDDGEEDAEYDEIDDEDDEEDDEEDKEGRRKSLKGKPGEGKGGFFKGLGKILGIGSDKEDKDEDDDEEDDDEEDDDEEETEDDEQIEDGKKKIDGEGAEDDDEALDYDYDEKAGSDEEVKPRRGKS